MQVARVDPLKEAARLAARHGAVLMLSYSDVALIRRRGDSITIVLKTGLVIHVSEHTIDYYFSADVTGCGE